MQEFGGAYVKVKKEVDLVVFIKKKRDLFVIYDFT